MMAAPCLEVRLNSGNDSQSHGLGVSSCGVTHLQCGHSQGSASFLSQGWAAIGAEVCKTPAYTTYIPGSSVSSLSNPSRLRDEPLS